jgi:hypothetical protein
LKKGVDEGSRSHAEALRGPACGDDIRRKIRQFAQRIGTEITIDYFASSCNALVPRFMTRTDEPESERTDAFSAASWDSSWCPHCGQHHREFGFYFPPSNLECCGTKGKVRWSVWHIHGAQPRSKDIGNVCREMRGPGT